MKRRIPAVFALLFVGIVLAAIGGSARAALTSPKLVAISENNGDTVVTYSQASSDDAVASVNVLVPTAYTSNFGFNDGDKVGTVTAQAIAQDNGGATMSLTGTLNFAVAADNVTYGGQTMTLGAAASACTGTAAPSAILVMNLSGGGQTVQIPLYENIIVAGQPFSSTSIYQLTICFPSPNTAAGTTGRAALGMKFTNVSVDFNGVFQPPPGWYVWHAQVVPYNAGAATPNSGGGVEVETEDRLPQQLSLSAVVKKKTNAVYAAGRLLDGGKGLGGVEVDIKAGTKVVAKTKTNAAGSFATPLTAPVRTITATATVPDRSLGGSCILPLLAPLPCSGPTIAGFTVSSDKATVPRV